MEPSFLTVLLEPTNLRIAFLILRNEPPRLLRIFHGLFDFFISLRRLHYRSFLLFT